MKCAWNELLAILPPRFRAEVDNLGRENLEEVRLRIHSPVELILKGQSHMLSMHAVAQDIQYVVNTASRYSPWAASTASQGYITAPGGHRIGMCGDCVVQAGVVTGIRTATSLCIRVARSFTGIADGAPTHGSLLVLGPPGVGKTTLLRELIRMRSHSGTSVAVVDERGEIFPEFFEKGQRVDVLTGCSKAQGVEMALRTMSPRCIAVDEITAPGDCQALLNAAWCGVDLLATAHASNCSDLMRRPVYRSLADSGLFSCAIVLSKDKSWNLERMKVCT